MPSRTLQIALFGESDVGKSHYGGQLVGRLNAETGTMRMRGAAPDLTAFDDVRQSLSEGISAAHTSAGTYTETLLPVVAEDDIAIDLNWPDYAGEQVSQLLEERRIPASWQKRVETADGWILMVRPRLAKVADDIFSRPLGDLQSPRTDAATRERSPQARLVELLQMLVYTTQSRTGKIKPAVAILLSCWDELEEAEALTPEQVLRGRLPLLSAYLRNNWDARQRLVFGLSATGVALFKESPNKEFIYQGPEQMGYVVRTDGSRTPDLTTPIAQLARIIQN